jgi:parvulin-like peptidyl-prolyl isomerase
MKRKIKHLLRRTKNKLQPGEDSDYNESLPRITNETVAVHRDEVLASARKYIYPLQHSKNRIVTITTALAVAAVVAFVSYCMLALYKFQATDSFIYRVTQVVPFPIAKTGSSFVAYENYLFELRHYTHYYVTQQKLDLNSEAGKQQIAEYKKSALATVINDAYVKRLAAQKNITVTDQEVQHEIDLARSENRLGNSQKVLEEVLKESWGWSLDDFKRVLRQRLLEQKVVSALDADTHRRADAALVQVKNGMDFATAAAKFSDDAASKANGGDYGFLIDKTNRDVDPKVADALFKMQPGQVSDVINTGYSLEIDKVISVQENKVRAAHIVFNFKDISNYVNDLKENQKYTTYIRLK